jgi:hypothetical protein
VTAQAGSPAPMPGTGETSPAQAAPWLTVAQMAVWSGLSVKHVRGHAAELGGFRVPGDGAVGRWRFDPVRSRELLVARLDSEQSQVPPQPATAGKRAASRKRSSGAGAGAGTTSRRAAAELLPVRGGAQ